MNKWLEENAGSLKPLTKSEVTSLQKEYKTVYLDRLRRRVRMLAESDADTRADSIIDEVLGGIEL